MLARASPLLALPLPAGTGQRGDRRLCPGRWWWASSALAGVEPGEPAKQRGGCVEGFVPPRLPVHWAAPVHVSFAGFVLVDAGLPARAEVSPVAVGRSTHAASGADAHGVHARVLQPAGRSRVVPVAIQLGTALALLPL